MRLTGTSPRAFRQSAASLTVGRPRRPRSARPGAVGLVVLLAGAGLLSPTLSLGRAADPAAAGDIPQPAPVAAELVERWDARYRGDERPSWDTGRPSTELRRLVEEGVVRPGRALELGCGTGVNAVYLASQGFEVTAIDLAPTALRFAEERAKAAGVQVRWIQADVLNPPPLEPFDFIFDRGCYHGVRQANAAGYAKTLETLSRPGGTALILAGNANQPGPRYGPPRVTETDLVGDLAGAFAFVHLRQIRFDTANPDVPGAWAWSVLLRRRAPTEP